MIQEKSCSSGDLGSLLPTTAHRTASRSFVVPAICWRIAKDIGSNSTKKRKSTRMPFLMLFKAISNTGIFVSGSHRLEVLYLAGNKHILLYNVKMSYKAIVKMSR